MKTMIARITVVIAAALLAAAPAAAQRNVRAGAGEVYFGPVFIDGKDYSFEGGSSAQTDTGFGLVLGFAKNFSPHLSAGVEVEWSEQDYRATVQPGVGNANSVRQINGYIESRTFRFVGTFNLSARAFTPFVTGGLGWSYIDTNIPAGLPENVCWFYPWYGTYCETFVPTQTSTEFSYNLGAGLRYDFGAGLARFMVNSQWVDFGGSYGSSNVIQYRIDIGTKF
jgi:opacity protein-like surface antigen